jgi:hypothetical protein
MTKRGHTRKESGLSIWKSVSITIPTDQTQTMQSFHYMQKKRSIKSCVASGGSAQQRRAGRDLPSPSAWQKAHGEPCATRWETETVPVRSRTRQGHRSHSFSSARWEKWGRHNQIRIKEKRLFLSTWPGAWRKCIGTLLTKPSEVRSDFSKIGG